MKVAVLGSNGQLGSDVVEAFVQNGDEVAILTHEDIELTSTSSVDEALSTANAEFIVNAAAMHHVEKCEADPSSAFATNALGAKNVAEWAKRAGVTVAYVSTDYVFNGDKNSPYVEGDVASPHLTGAAIDIGKRGMSFSEIAWMRAHLLPLQTAGKIDVEEEFYQSCFHITVYRSYAPPAPPRMIATRHRTTGTRSAGELLATTVH